MSFTTSISLFKASGHIILGLLMNGVHLLITCTYSRIFSLYSCMSICPNINKKKSKIPNPPPKWPYVSLFQPNVANKRLTFGREIEYTFVLMLEEWIYFTKCC